MVKCKKGDFIELDYTGKIKDSETIFDTTNVKVAKESGFFREGVKYEPVVVCIGENFVVKGLDKELDGKEIGKDYKINVNQENGFGKKDAKLLRIISKSKFTKEKINPFPGLVVNVDGLNGMVRSVTSGRVVVDFNHPLAGKELAYEFKIVKIVKDVKEKLNSVLKLLLGLDNFESEVKEGKALVKTKTKIPSEIEKKLEKEVKKLVPGIKSVKFEAK